jgi:hypothetical protein
MVRGAALRELLLLGSGDGLSALSGIAPREECRVGSDHPVVARLLQDVRANADAGLADQGASWSRALLLRSGEGVGYLISLCRTRHTPIASGSRSHTTHVVATRPHWVALRACSVIGANVVELSIQERKLCSPTADVSAETAHGGRRLCDAHSPRSATITSRWLRRLSQPRKQDAQTAVTATGVRQPLRHTDLANSRLVT